jgi:hypothetical protein
MNTSLSKREINRQRWLEHIDAWKQSELTQKAYCEQHHLGLAAFQRWHRIFMTVGIPKTSSPVTFVPVNVTEPSASRLSLLINDKLRLEIPAGFDPVTLRQVVQTLQAS